MDQDALKQIESHMPVAEFRRIMNRLSELRGEEEQKLKALAELQQYYVGARSDQERDSVKKAVGDIRELSRATRQEIRDLNTQLAAHFPLEVAQELFRRLES